MIDYPICVFDPVKETILNDQQLIRFIDERYGRDVAETVQSLRQSAESLRRIRRTPLTPPAC